MNSSLPIALCTLVLMVGNPSYAQLPGSGHDQPLLPWSAFADDPIGLDAEAIQQEREKRTDASKRQDETGSKRQSESADLTYGPKPRHGRARAGQVLTAMPSVREVLHEQTVTFEDGLARIDVHLRFENSIPEPAEIMYRLAVPPGARLNQLRVCIEKRCRAGLEASREARFSAYDAALLARGPDGAGSGFRREADPAATEIAGTPIAQADLAQDDRGAFLRVQAAPSVAGHALDVFLSYAIETATYNGTTRLNVPARGMDPRVAPAKVSIFGGDLVNPRIDGIGTISGQAAEVPAWAPTSAEASLAINSSSEFSVGKFRCAGKHCARVFSRAPAQRSKARHLILALDVSPSMAGPARNRLPAALKGIVDAAPKRTTLQALRFASHAQVALKKPARARNFDLQTLGDLLIPPDLGSATRLQSAIDMAVELAKDPQVRRSGVQLVVLGDGQLTTGSANFMRAVSEAGFSLTLINLADMPVSQALADKLHQAQIVEAGAVARAVENYGETGAWQDRMASLFAPTTLRAGKCTWRMRPGQTQSQRLAPVMAGDSQQLLLTQDQPLGKLRCSRGKLRANTHSRSRPGAVAGGWTSAQRFASPLRALVAVDPADLHRPCTDFPITPRWLPKRKSEARSCDRRGPAERVSGINRDDSPIIQARARSCMPVPKVNEANKAASIGTGMPSEPLREMLRMRIIPAARECFRRDRAGRADYSVRAVFRFELASQEVVHSAVEGRIEARLRNCLLTAVDRLHVPRFSGRIKVTYPLRTIKEAVPPRIELSDDTSNSVDTLLEE